MPRSIIKIRQVPVRVMGVFALWLLVALPVTFAMASYADTILSEAGDIIGSGEIVVLKPDTWVGKRFPLLGYIASSDELKRGTWLVLLYHHDCPKCRRAIGDLKRISDTLGAEQVALVELPPYHRAVQAFHFGGIKVVHKHLDDAREWFVESPVGVLISEGFVFDIRQAQWFTEKGVETNGQRSEGQGMAEGGTVTHPDLFRSSNRGSGVRVTSCAPLSREGHRRTGIFPPRSNLALAVAVLSPRSAVTTHVAGAAVLHSPI